MSRKEIVLLVSRAIAVLQMVAALADAVTSLPQPIYLIYRQASMIAAMPALRRLPGQAPSMSINPLLWISLATALAHIAVLLLSAVLFWCCGSMVQRWLAPAAAEPEASA